LKAGAFYIWERMEVDRGVNNELVTHLYLEHEIRHSHNNSINNLSYGADFVYVYIYLLISIYSILERKYTSSGLRLPQP